MAIDESRLKEIITELKGMGIMLSDIEKEVTLRNKWGKKQNPSMTSFTTDEITSAAEKWMRF